MKKLYMCTIIGSSGRNSVLVILFQLYGSKVGLFKGNLLWVGLLHKRIIDPIIINNLYNL